MDTLNTIWNDQLEFNNQFRRNPSPNPEVRTAETKELILHMHDESHELLRKSGAWKTHRRDSAYINQQAVKLELVDIFKYWISICQLWGFTPEDMLEAYWEKSMVVRQRYAEEFVKSLDRPYVVVDIDNVLADYIGGFMEWAYRAGEIVSQYPRPRYIDAQTLGLPTRYYNSLKHNFRTSGQHALLPLMPGTRGFLELCRRSDWLIVLLTSRPIDRYPNLHAETLRWLTMHDLPYDFVWWSRDKAELCMDKSQTGDNSHLLQFAVDDEWQYVQQFVEAGIVTYWVHSTSKQFPPGVVPPDNLIKVANLHDLTRLITERITCPTKTPSTDLMPDIPEKNPETPSSKPPIT